MIGRRFKLVHVHFGREIIEVATFRANHPEEDDEDASQLASRNESGRILRDNVYGTLGTTPSAGTSPSMRCTTTRPASASSTTPAACTTSAIA